MAVLTAILSPFQDPPAEPDRFKETGTMTKPQLTDRVKLLRAARQFMADAEAGDPGKFAMICKKFTVLSPFQIKHRTRLDRGFDDPDTQDGKDLLHRQAHADWLRSHFEDQ